MAAGFDTKGVPIPTEEQLKFAALISLRKLDKIVENLQNKRLVLIARSDPNPFWISDNPVVMSNGFPYGEIGFTEKGIEIYMPISQDFVLGFWCLSLEIKMEKLLAVRAFGDDHKRMSAMFNGLRAGEPISPGPGTTTQLNGPGCKFFSVSLWTEQ